MTEERTMLLRQRMIEDMHLRGLGDRPQKAHIRANKDLAQLRRPCPDNAILEDSRAHQLLMTDAWITPTMFYRRREVACHLL